MRKLAGPGMPCPKEVKEFFTLYFTLRDKGEVLRRCDETDDRDIVRGENGDEVEDIGANLQKVVAYVDEILFTPEAYDLLSVHTEVCEYPTFVMEESDEQVGGGRRDLARRRRRRTYTYTATNTCQRCTTARRLLRLGDDDQVKAAKVSIDLMHRLGDDEQPKAEEAEEASVDPIRRLGDDDQAKADKASVEACGSSDVAKYALSVCEEGLEAVQMYCQKAREISEKLVNEKKGIEGMKKIVEIEEEVIPLMEDAESQSQVAATACLGAQDCAAAGDKEGAEEHAKTAEKAAKEDTKAAQDMSESFKKAKAVAKKLAEELSKEKLDRIHNANKAQVEERKNNLELLGRGRDREREKIEEEMKALEKEDPRRERMKREIELIEEENKKAMEAAEADMKAFQEALDAEEKYLKELEKYRLSMEFADDLEGAFFMSFSL